MANVQTSYFFPPQWTFHVGGPISLGNILHDPKTPQYALNDEDRQPLPKLFIDDTKSHFAVTITNNKAKSAGIGSSLLQLFGFSADLAAERTKTLTWTIEADQLATQEINPKASYVETCFKHPEVQSFLRKTKFRKELYMITGIMAVSSATVSSEIGQKHLFSAKLGGNLAPVAAGVPVEAHVSGSISGDRGKQGSFGKSDFILGGANSFEAYKLRKIQYLKTQSVKDMKDVYSGTVLDNDRPALPLGDEVEEEDQTAEAQFLGLEDSVAGRDEFEFAAVEAQVSRRESSGGETIEFVLPVESEDVE
ncbi:hypothetical protein AYO21_08136 [Fonsecaea monophora]|uniref:Uncharacterized protein n=1 Tax=Fonsecaea monophora TaxID=254056 RepID=A0A177F2W2_9EURO|nr:hypothetical protein AYO21_08136 [Fonsecaea monophora]KAH0837206.1 hypothetical protein FOPE_04777 [Fonsecaea pedrosoi]OAG37652.1 hypothetical protein AYO21_08136 [Fonsecaea monophora]